MNSQLAITKLSALAQESRLEIFRLLVPCGTKGMSAGQIAETTKIQPNTLSFHLKELNAAGLINSQRQGRSIIYSIQIEGVRNLIGFLTEDCCEGRPELCTPTKDHCC
ncbi:ArsR/SmtB family transcription factor [Rubritalea tangerina]|uniref:ArsR/SmtB family transcription factor n=2 Tax=Rubritalea tangerina TaxID=430798 RepID=A0ABW4ZE14_9BACT